MHTDSPHFASDHPDIPSAPPLTIEPNALVDGSPQSISEPNSATDNPEHPGEHAGAAPFVLVLYQRDKTPSGYFRPEAAIEISAVLRTSGLLTVLPTEEMQSLLCLLTFVTPNGDCLPTLAQLANALKLSEGKTRSRMRRLCEFKWHGKPLVSEIHQETGGTVFAPARSLFTVRNESPEPLSTSLPSYPAAGREAIMAHSRSQYARPRVEVEREIALLNGWDDPHPETPEEQERAEIKRRLLTIGLSREQAESLLQRFQVEAILRQLEWLPYRNANHPARFLMAAIEGDYEAPLSVRLQYAAQEESIHEEAKATAAQSGSDAEEVPFAITPSEDAG